jgi:hypothetical protein
MAYTTIDNPELYFQTKLYSGNNGTQSITLDGSENMRPDWVWIKPRNGSDGHVLTDSVRGALKRLRTEGNNAEDTLSGSLSSFDSDGFTVGNAGEVNSSSYNFVSWNWLAGGSASSNSDGSITSSVSANTTAGFSIVTVADIGTTDFTFGHGLGVAPSWVLAKSRDGGKWNNYFKVLGANYTIQLDQTSAKISNSTMWQNTHPTSSVVSANGNQLDNNESYVFYCFAEKKGYSKFGSYTGNANTDGPYIYTGFSPAWVMVKATDATKSWYIWDNKRSTSGSNLVDDQLLANTTDSEFDGSNIDMLSNGFKFRSSGSGEQGSGTNYIYMAFAESPFVSSGGIPTTAR